MMVRTAGRKEITSPKQTKPSPRTATPKSKMASSEQHGWGVQKSPRFIFQRFALHWGSPAHYCMDTFKGNNNRTIVADQFNFAY
jgi:hypothetical protein